MKIKFNNKNRFKEFNCTGNAIDEINKEEENEDIKGKVSTIKLKMKKIVKIN